MKILYDPKKHIRGPINAYDAGKLLFGEESSENAGRAAKEMKTAGWKFWTYDEWGSEVHVPADWDEEPGPFPLPIGYGDPEALEKK